MKIGAYFCEQFQAKSIALEIWETKRIRVSFSKKAKNYHRYHRFTKIIVANFRRLVRHYFMVFWWGKFCQAPKFFFRNDEKVIIEIIQQQTSLYLHQAVTNSILLEKLFFWNRWMMELGCFSLAIETNFCALIFAARIDSVFGLGLPFDCPPWTITYVTL